MGVQAPDAALVPFDVSTAPQSRATAIGIRRVVPVTWRVNKPVRGGGYWVSVKIRALDRLADYYSHGHRILDLGGWFS